MASIFSEANLKFTSILVTAIIGIGGLLLNVYKMEQSTALEARRPFLEKQLELCLEATNAVAAIAAGVPASSGGENADEIFRRLYLGKLALVEDDNVACAMTRFNMAYGQTLDAKADITQMTGSMSVSCSRDVPELQPAALEVAQACRELIVKSWGADIQLDVRNQPGK